jgi:hypothetical protein
LVINQKFRFSGFIKEQRSEKEQLKAGKWFEELAEKVEI